MYIVVLIISLLIFNNPMPIQPENTVHSGAMQMAWTMDEHNMHVELSSPTDGWLAIGFNTQSQLKGSMLIMARVRDGKAEVVDHYVVMPGVYRPFVEQGSPPVAFDVSGKETAAGTEVSFSLRLNHYGPLETMLEKGQAYFLHMAYSLDDNFQHHSVHRTLETITL